MYILGIYSYVKEKNIGEKRKDMPPLIHMQITYALMLDTSCRNTADRFQMSKREEVKN